jgi:RecJ-like exonuclease
MTGREFCAWCDGDGYYPIYDLHKLVDVDEEIFVEKSMVECPNCQGHGYIDS